MDGFLCNFREILYLRIILEFARKIQISIKLD